MNYSLLTKDPKEAFMAICDIAANLPLLVYTVVLAILLVS